MRSLRLPAFLLALIFTSAAFAANLIQNSGFDITDTAGQPEGWATRVWAPPRNDEVISKYGAETKSGGMRGTKCIVLSMQGRTIVYGLFTRAIDVSTLKPGRLLFSCRYKTEGQPLVQALVTSYDRDFMEKQWETPSMASEARSFMASKGWRDLTWHTELRPGTKQVVVMFQIMREGKISIDDVVLRTVPDEVTCDVTEMGRVVSLPNNRRIMLKLEKTTPEPLKVRARVNFFNQENKASGEVSREVIVDPATPSEVELKYRYSVDQIHRAQLEIRAIPTDELLYYGTYDVSGLIDAQVQIPAFRHAMVPSRQENEIRITGRLNGVPALADTLQLRARNSGTATDYSEGSGITRGENGAFRLVMPGEGLLIGRHEIKIEAISGKNPVAVTTLNVDRAAPAKAEVTFDNEQRLCMNERRVFPLGIVNVTELTDLEPIREAGFNVISVPQRKASYILAESCVPKNIALMISSPNTMKEFWQGLQTKFGNHPALLGWEFMRRPDADLIHPDIMLALYQIVSAVSENHPTATMLTYLEGMDDYAKATDILMPYEMTIPMQPVTRIAAVTEAAIAASHGRKPVWPVIQTVGRAWAENKALDAKTDGRMPTPAEVRAQAYLAVLHGANGLMYYTYQLTSGEREQAFRITTDTPETWQIIAKTNHEMTDLAPVISISSARTLLPEAGDGQIQLARWTTEDKDLVIAVNTSADSLITTFSIPDCVATELSVMFENRKLTSETPGNFGDIFEPFGVHIYSLR